MLFSTRIFGMSAAARDRRPLGSGCMSLLVAGMYLACVVVVAPAAQWIGAGQITAMQVRDWPMPTNWNPPGPHPPTDIHGFNFLGEGQINLLVPQTAGGLNFADFCSTHLAAGPTAGSLTLQAPGVVAMGEGVRDTYGVDYFTAGPRISAPLSLSSLNFQLGLPPGVGGDDAAMLLSGPLVPAGPATVNVNGQGNNSTLWIASNNDWRASGGGAVNVGSPGPSPGFHTYALRLVDSARLDGAMITLNDALCALGLHDNTRGPAANWYRNTVVTNYGNIFTDRSYALNDLDGTINGVERLDAVRAVGVGPVGVNFGLPGTFGRTNNGFSLLVDVLTLAAPAETFGIGVHNGNLTEQRGGSRYMSGANRLQEAHNYVSVDDLRLPQPQQPFGKFGTGVLWVNELNANLPLPMRNIWSVSPTVQAGVLRLGWMSAPPNPQIVHTMTPGQQMFLTKDSALGLAWNAIVDLTVVPQVPFPITPGGGIPGQSGAVNIDLWGHSAPTIDTNIGPIPAPNYLRVASSMGGDASFDTQPLPTKHASTAAQITPYVKPPQTGDVEGIYYLGGGGGTLRIDSQLTDWVYLQQPIPCWLEMGTTGTLLPGRVALCPGGEQGGAGNSYTGRTDVRAGTLQLINGGAVAGTSMVIVNTYNDQIRNALYDYQLPAMSPYTWKGPGMLLLDPSAARDWRLTAYATNGGAGNLSNSLLLNGGVIGWTGDVNITGVPGNYGATILSNLNPAAPANVNVFGLGGEYSAGTMFFFQFGLTDNKQTPVLLYKAGKNSTLDLRQTAGSTYTGGTIIAGGTIVIDNPAQLNAGEESLNGGPIAILNGGRLRVAKPLPGLPDLFLTVPIKVNTDGTPDIVKNCGSVIETDAGVNLVLMRALDFGWNPTAYLEKAGSGTLTYAAPPAKPGPANAWGLKLTEGLVVVNQLPVNPSADSGPVIFNNGHLQVNRAAPGALHTDPAYGFRNIVSFQGTSSTVTVDDDALFRTHGSVPNEILGTVQFRANDRDGIPGNSVVHLSRNMASAPANMPADFSRGTGRLTFEGVTVYMSGGGGAAGGSGPLNVLPMDAGFVLTLGDGVAFHASHQNVVSGEVNFSNTDPTRPVQINGAEAVPATPAPAPPPPPYQFTLQPDVWSIVGTGYTTWSKRTEKIGTGTVEFVRMQGTPVSLGSGATLAVLDGKLVARGTADPFTDNTGTGKSLTIINDATNPGLGYGLRIEEGSKSVASISGIGDTYVLNAGTTLTTSSIVQNSLTIGAGSAVVIAPVPAAGAAAVPEPSAWALLLTAGFWGLTAALRRWRKP